MPTDLTLILGASGAPARALAARIAASASSRVVLVDQADPLRSLLAERAPMLGHDAPSLDGQSWQSLVDADRVSGTSIDRDVVAWTVATLGLLRPSAIVVCVAEYDTDQAPNRHATVLSNLASTLSRSLAAINQYFALLTNEESAHPRLLLTVSGTLDTAADAGVAGLVDALTCELLTHAQADPDVVLLPRLLGPGASRDSEFLTMLRELLLGNVLRFPAPTLQQVSSPRWLSTRRAAALLDTLLTHHADTPLSDALLGATITQGRRARIIAERGHAAELAYVAMLIADELDRLLPDAQPRRSTLLRAAPDRERLQADGCQLADTIRSAVRWFAANASLLTQRAS
jgi:hypothetical protein